MTFTAEAALEPSAPYRPSFLMRLFGAIDRLPFGGWWFYAVLYLVSAAYGHVALWATGARPVGMVVPEITTAVFFGPFLLAMTHVLSRTAARAIDTFRPASGLSEADFAARRYDLITLPAGGVWISLAFGAIAGIATILASPAAGLAPYGSTVLAAIVVIGPLAAFGYGAGAIFVFQSLRQLRNVARLLDGAPAINLFETPPIFAFSRLTAAVGLIGVFIGYYSVATNGAYVSGNAVAIFVLVACMVLGVACFILPLLGVHGRLVHEKDGLVDGINSRFEVLRSDLYGRVDGAALSGVKDVTDALSGLEVVRGTVDRLPTWPWPPALLRGFLSAIILPVVVYLLTRVAAVLVG